MSSELPKHPRRDGRVIDIGLHVLDRAIVDRDGVPVQAVDDVEIELADDGSIAVTSLIVGSGLTNRFFGGHRPRHLRVSIPWNAVAKLDTAVHLSSNRDDLDATWQERWLRDRILAHIPGSGHAGE